MTSGLYHNYFMGWLSKFFGDEPKEEHNNIILTGNLAWKVTTPKDHARFVEYLSMILPEDAILLLGGTPVEDVKELLESKGTRQTFDKVGARILGFEISIKSDCYLLPATSENIKKLAYFFDNKAAPEICDLLHAYNTSGILMLCHDIRDDPILFSEAISEEKVKMFCEAVGCNYKEHKEHANLLVDS